MNLCDELEPEDSDETMQIDNFILVVLVGRLSEDNDHEPDINYNDIGHNNRYPGECVAQYFSVNIIGSRFCMGRS